MCPCSKAATHALSGLIFSLISKNQPCTEPVQIYTGHLMSQTLMLPFQLVFLGEGAVPPRDPLFKISSPPRPGNFLFFTIKLQWCAWLWTRYGPCPKELAVETSQQGLCRDMIPSRTITSLTTHAERKGLLS